MTPYKYWLNVEYVDGYVDYFGSDNLLFLIEMGEDGLKSGRYISANVEEGEL